MRYCGSKGPGGWFCVLAAGHSDEHLTIRNDRLWKGSPGAPFRWTDTQVEPALDPLLSTSEVAKIDPTKLAMLLGYTGEICSLCGSTSVRRAGTCSVCEACGTTTSCG